MSKHDHRPYHLPQGDPCKKCWQPAQRHRVSHYYKGTGDLCSACGLLKTHHRVWEGDPRYFAGIDGEGQGREDHRYVMLAWSNESGSRRDMIEAGEGLSLTTVECLEFILRLPVNARAFAFAFNYDLTKMLTDVDNETLYYLFRPDLRKRKPGYEKFGPRPVIWHGYQLNLVGTKFQVKKGNQRRTVWDTFKFFQCKFTQALKDWKVGTEQELAEMERMKHQRAEFDKLSREEIGAYCYDECRKMATLAHRLVDAHETAGLKLRAYHGAGSTASAVLKRLGIDKVERRVPKELNHAVASAFFGGRFENARIGTVDGPIWGYDISSAYPYQLTFLPCLGCGHWRRIRKRGKLDGATTAVVRYRLGKPVRGMTWGPFPFRCHDASIAFPATSGGGWLWLQEYLMGEKLFPHVEFVEAWVYDNDCDHKPFDEIPKLYLERLRIGKEGPGIVIKLGCNACYGKLAQSLGDKPPFQSWPWAGMITSGTRAQILEMLGLHRDRRNLLMVATDGIQSLERLQPPKPRDTGTDNEYRKPLGGWEEKESRGMFYARPGVYFPQIPKLQDNEMKTVRARGIGRKNALDAYERMIGAWRSGAQTVRIAKVARFYGAKSSIGRAGRPGDYYYVRHSMLGSDGKPLYNRGGIPRPRYGQWDERPIDLSFDPLPKRAKVNRDGSTLQIRSFPQDLESLPYTPSLLSLEAWNLKAFTAEILEQPDGADFADYDEQ